MPIATPQGTLDFKSVDKVTFVGASSNTVIDTTTGSLGVGVDVNGPTSNLHVVGNTRLEGDIDMLHTANTASIKLNSNVVTEFPRSKKLMKFPRVALTSAANNAYENGYKITTSSTTTWSGKYAFDGILGSTSGSLWYTGELFHYTGTDGAAASTAPLLDTNTDRGQWLGIELPVAIKLQYFYLWQQPNDVQHFPKSGTIYAKKETNDPWVEIYRYDDRTRTHQPDVPEIFNNVNSEVAYKYFVLVCTKRLSQNLSPGYGVAIGEWQLFGVPEYDPDADGTDVKVTSYPNVPNTDWLEVYYDAKNYSGSGDVQDETGNNIDATIGAATTFDSVNKAWSFSGTSNRDGTEFVSGYLPSDFEGQQIHSVSMWLKFDYWHDGAFCIIGKETRTNSDDHKAIHFQFQGTNSGSPRILYDFWDNQKSFYLPDDVQPGKWLHMTATYSGDAANRKMFVNGQELTTFTTNSAYATELALDTTNDLVVRLGTRFPVSSSYIFHGDIANFRLFNRALTSDEIYQLYAYQKEYFGHGDLGMTLKAGRLGIGTSEPRALLDVRGHARVQGDVRVGGRLLASVPYYAARQRDTQSYVFDESIVYDQYVYTNYPGSFVANSATDGYYQPPMNGVYQVHMECIVQGSGNIHIQRRTGTTVDLSHDDRHFNYTHSGWMSTSAGALIPITNHVTQNIRIFIDVGSGNGAWAYNTYHGSAFFLWVSDIPERRQHHVG